MVRAPRLCPKCRTPYVKNQERCASCGHNLLETLKPTTHQCKNPKCGAMISSPICPHCGWDNRHHGESPRPPRTSSGENKIKHRRMVNEEELKRIREQSKKTYVPREPRGWTGKRTDIPRPPRGWKGTPRPPKPRIIPRAVSEAVRRVAPIPRSMQPTRYQDRDHFIPPWAVTRGEGYRVDPRQRSSNEIVGVGNPSFMDKRKINYKLRRNQGMPTIGSSFSAGFMGMGKRIKRKQVEIGSVIVGAVFAMFFGLTWVGIGLIFFAFYMIMPTEMEVIMKAEQKFYKERCPGCLRGKTEDGRNRGQEAINNQMNPKYKTRLCDECVKDYWQTQYFKKMATQGGPQTGMGTNPSGDNSNVNWTVQG